MKSYARWMPGTGREVEARDQFECPAEEGATPAEEDEDGKETGRGKRRMTRAALDSDFLCQALFSV